MQGDSIMVNLRLDTRRGPFVLECPDSDESLGCALLERFDTDGQEPSVEPGLLTLHETVWEWYFMSWRDGVWVAIEPDTSPNPAGHARTCLLLLPTFARVEDFVRRVGAGSIDVPHWDTIVSFERSAMLARHVYMSRPVGVHMYQDSGWYVTGEKHLPDTARKERYLRFTTVGVTDVLRHRPGMFDVMGLPSSDRIIEIDGDRVVAVWDQSGRDSYDGA